MWSRLSILLMLLGLALAPSALADSYTLSTSGCFSGGTCSSNGSSSTNFGKDATLSFTNVGSTSVGSGTSFSLGTLDLSLLNPGIAGPYTGSFILTVDFTNPSQTTGSPFVASLLGGVFLDAAGAIINFQQDAQVFSYPGGSFTLDLGSDPIILTSWTQPMQIEAKIVSGAVSMSEGSSLAMLGISGLVLVGAFFKKHNPLANRAC